MIEQGKNIDLFQFSNIEIDDMVYTDIEEFDLIKKINVLVKIKDMFDENLFGNMYLGRSDKQKIIKIFYDNADFLNEHFLKNTEVISLKTWPAIDSISDADLFLININHEKANECCSNLRLRNKYKPIVLTYNDERKEQAILSMNLNIGCTDIINISSDPVITACRLNSLIKYKKIYESFSKKLKRSLYLSAIDATTEIYNRSFLEEYIRNISITLNDSAIIMIDVDKFKFINDKYGHAFADSMLKYVSGIIKRYIRSSDVIARYGGDEFIIIMENVTKAEVAEISNRIQRKIVNSTFGDAQCTVSIGVCCIEPAGNTSIQEAISIADKFMYIAKQGGGNSVKICA